MNTRLNLMYRDASNYKAHVSVVLKGKITKDQIESIRSKLDSGEFFIAHQVGLPTPSAQFVGKDGFPNLEIDHVWTTIELDKSPEDFVTDNEATLNMTVDELVKRFDATTWDVSGEWDRLCNLG